ncbi:MAG: class I SAM-dependent methyltransferase [Chloroflexota bacterium]|nr:class I SAM-dependent methyltransferase [Chloroflexota bacterium]
MSNRSIGLDDALHAYLVEVGVREPEVLRRIRERTASLPEHGMQIAPEQAAFMAMLVRLMGARECLEVGTFTGYSSTAVGLALPADGHLVCCDVSREWTDIAREGWADAGVADKIELRLGPAIETLDALLADGEAGRFDFAFIDADKPNYDGYVERSLRLVHPGALIAIDNTLWSGRVADPSVTDESTQAIRALNAKLAQDERVDLALTPIGDGLTLLRVR